MIFFLHFIFFLFFDLSYLSCVESTEKPLVVVIPSYNNIKWYEKNLNSVFSQKYSNYRVIYIDDASTDGTADAVERYIKKQNKEKKVNLRRNKDRLGCLENHYRAINYLCKDEEIVLCLDGDDWLANDRVFNIINQAYSKNNILATHGTLKEYPGGNVAWSIPIPQEIIEKNLFRTYRCPTHLKTFYAWLFKRIQLEDLLYNGNFFQATGDQAIMFPIIEMAGGKHEFIKDIIYIYNMSNPIGDSIVNKQLQREMEQVIRNRKPYKPIDSQ